MCLSTSYFSIFSEYVSILLFICLPVVILSASLAIWLHYRQKRRKAAAESMINDADGISLTTADKTSHSVALSPLAPEDKIGLIRECRKQLRKSKAKYMALKSDFTSVLKNIASAGNLLTENDSQMEKLTEKIVAYEKQVGDLQKKLEVLESVIPVRDERNILKQTIQEKDQEIDQLKETLNKVAGIAVQLESSAKMEQLIQENADLNKKLNEKEEELVRNRQLLDTLYKETGGSAGYKTRGIAKQSLS